jgi:hypothetical protein
MTTIFSTFFHTLADFLETPSNELPKTPRYGWIPDVPDRRDDYIPHYPTDSDDEYVVRPPSKPETESETNNDPSSTTLDLRLNMPAIYDDHGLGCSTVSALATLLEFHQLQEDPESDYEPSRLFLLDCHFSNCLLVSAITIPAETATFSDLEFSLIGIVITSCTLLNTLSGTPALSRPTSKKSSFLKSNLV